MSQGQVVWRASTPRRPKKVEATAETAARKARTADQQQKISKEIAAAIADGRIPESAAPRWRSRLTVQGDQAVAELRSLQSVTAILAKAAETPPAKTASRLPPSTPAPAEAPSLLAPRSFSLAGSVEDGVAAKKAAENAGSLAASAAAGDGVVSDPSTGALSWNGLPVSPGPDGSPLVHTMAGAMTVDAFRAAGLDAETERVAVALGRVTGTASKAGVPTRNMLLGGS